MDDMAIIIFWFALGVVIWFSVHIITYAWGIFKAFLQNFNDL